MIELILTEDDYIKETAKQIVSNKDHVVNLEKYNEALELIKNSLKTKFGVFIKCANPRFFIPADKHSVLKVLEDGWFRVLAEADPETNIFSPYQFCVINVSESEKFMINESIDEDEFVDHLESFRELKL